MRGVYFDNDGKGALCNFDENDAVRSYILNNVSRYFCFERNELIDLINKGEIEYVERYDETDYEWSDIFDRAREELTINTLNWYIENDLKHFRERDERITREDIMEAYLKAAAVFNVAWTVVGKDYSRCDAADYLSNKGFTI